MPDYRVTWEIDIEAETPEDAARQARAIQRNPKAWAGAFDVFDEDGDVTRVDLDETEHPNRGRQEDD